MSTATEYVLNRIVPAMERGFTIQTPYGELVVEPSQLADKIAALVKAQAESELKKEVARG